jgi:hypothetical protein
MPQEFGSEDGSYEALSDTALPPRPGVQPAAALSRLNAQGRRGGGGGHRLGIDESGTVVFGRIVRSLGREFDAAVIDWARGIRFRPALTKGPGPHALPDQAPRTLQA